MLVATEMNDFLESTCIARTSDRSINDLLLRAAYRCYGHVSTSRTNAFAHLIFLIQLLPVYNSPRFLYLHADLKHQ
jgi:hypothetical protein